MFRENETPEVLPKGTPGFRPSRWISSESLAVRTRAVRFAMPRALVFEKKHAATALLQPCPTPSEAM